VACQREQAAATVEAASAAAAAAVVLPGVMAEHDGRAAAGGASLPCLEVHLVLWTLACAAAAVAAVAAVAAAAALQQVGLDEEARW